MFRSRSHAGVLAAIALCGTCQCAPADGGSASVSEISQVQQIAVLDMAGYEINPRSLTVEAGQTRTIPQQQQLRRGSQHPRGRSGQWRATVRRRQQSVRVVRPRVRAAGVLHGRLRHPSDDASRYLRDATRREMTLVGRARHVDTKPVQVELMRQ